MSKQIFNRNEPSIIKSAIEADTLQDFINLYKDTTTANEKTLTQAYHDIKYNSKISTIRMKSGSTSNSEPIDSIEPIKKNGTAKVEKAVTSKESKIKVEKSKLEKKHKGISKQDKIIELLKLNKTNKEITIELESQGFKVYGSEISTAKEKLNA